MLRDGIQIMIDCPTMIVLIHLQHCWIMIQSTSVGQVRKMITGPLQSMNPSSKATRKKVNCAQAHIWGMHRFVPPEASGIIREMHTVGIMIHVYRQTNMVRF